MRYLILIVISLLLIFCQNPGKVLLNTTALSQLTPLPNVNPTPTANMPGYGSTGGPEKYTFWAQDRSSKAGAGLGAFYQTNTEKLAYTDHFVIYRELTGTFYMSKTQAQSVLNNVEASYSKLTSVFGGGYVADVQQSGRVVVLALDIKDDFSTFFPAYFAGYFSPRDLFSDALTKAFYDDPIVIASYPTQTVVDLRGRSNQNQILYLDLNPYFNGVALNDTTRSQKLFQETILHEASHLFTYNRRVRLQKLLNHDIWIAEGTAEQAPHALLSMVETQRLRIEQHGQALNQAYLAQGPSMLTAPSEFENPNVGYMHANIFFQYLRGRAGGIDKGNELLSKIAVASDGTVAGVDSAIRSQFNNNQTFSSLFSEFVIATYLSSMGRNVTSIIDFSGSSASSLTERLKELSYSNIGIGNKGSTSSIRFGDDSTPLAFFSSSQCLEPASYIMFPYTISDIGAQECTVSKGNCTGPALIDCTTFGGNCVDKLTDYTPTTSGMNSQLKLALAYVKDDATTSLTLREYKPTDTILFRTKYVDVTFPTLPAVDEYNKGEQYHFIVYNPNSSGSCLNTGNLKVDIRNTGSWIGQYLSKWQTIPGAETALSDGYFFRQSGITMHTKNVHGGSKNYLYIADVINMTVNRWDADLGTFQNRMGGSNTDPLCAGDGSSPSKTPDSTADDGWKTFPGFGARTVNNYCRRSFDSPAGLAIDLNGNIYVADRGNHRIIKRNSAGAFIAWLGHTSDDKWQCEPGNSYQDCQGMSLLDPVSPVGLLDKTTNTKMFNSPWGMAIVEGAENDTVQEATINTTYSATATNIAFTGLTTASYLMRGNIIKVGSEKMLVTNITYGTTTSGTVTVKRGVINTTAAAISITPSTIKVMKSYLYVSSYGSHRIIRRDLNRGLYEGFIGNDQHTFTNTKSISIQVAHTGSTANRFSFPQGIDAEKRDCDTGICRLYIADSSNHRIVRYNINGTDASKEYLDGVSQTWSSTAITPGSGLNGQFSGPSDVKVDQLNSVDANQYLYVADKINNRMVRYSKTAQRAGWLGGGNYFWQTDMSKAAESASSTSYQLPPLFMINPQFLYIGLEADRGLKLDYLYVSSIYNGRIVRWNMNCAIDGGTGYPASYTNVPSYTSCVADQ